uniref:hypothetical protein n=1 Tax=Phocaeicola plebeius TaxID=310297 RepID=UPI0040288C75
KHEEHGGSEQSGIFLSVARSHASLLQIVDSQIKYFTLSQIYGKVRGETNEKRSFSSLAIPNRILSYGKIVKGERRDKRKR